MGFLDLFRRKKQTGDSIKKLDVVADEKIEEILNQEILNFFPNEWTWYSWCFKQPNDVNANYLHCHLRDNSWMSKLMHQKLIEKKLYIPELKIKNFIDTSKTFNELRHDYELEIVRRQIDWIRNDGGNWIIPEGFDEFSMVYSPDVDKMFRGGVVETLTAIGMDRETGLQ